MFNLFGYTVGEHDARSLNGAIQLARETFEISCVAQSSGAYSLVTRTGDLVFLLGRIPVDFHGREIGSAVAEQTEAVVETFSKSLSAIDTNLVSIVKTTVFSIKVE